MQRKWFQSMNWQHTTNDALIWNQCLRWNEEIGWHKLPGPGWCVKVRDITIRRAYRTLYGAKMAAKHWCD